MISIDDVKKRLVVNALSNILNVGITSLILMWLTPFLLNRLGVNVYGMYPLIANIVLYVMLFSSNYTMALSRFISLAIEKNDMKSGQTYFSTAVASLGFLNLFIFAVVLFASFFISSLINIPLGAETDTAIFFIFMMASSLVDTFASPFRVSTFITHKLYFQNASVIVSRILQIILIVIGFSLFEASLTIVGFSRFSMFLFQFIVALILTRHFLPNLKFSIKSFSWSAFKKMGKMSSWVTIDTIGSLFYLQSDLIVINLITNAKMVSLYAVVVQWVLFLRTLTPAISQAFSPIVIDLIAENKISDLAFHTRRAIKFMGIILAFPVGLLSGLSTPFLMVWLGPSFANLGLLMKIVIFPQIIFLSINPLYFINQSLNKVAIPAKVTFAGGILNVIFSACMLKYTSWGLYAVAIATVLSFMLRSICFTPVYTAGLLKQKWNYFLTPVIPGVILSFFVSFFCFVIASKLSLTSYTHLLEIGIITGLIYVPICLFGVLKRDEKRFLVSLIEKIFNK